MSRLCFVTILRDTITLAECPNITAWLGSAGVQNNNTCVACVASVSVGLSAGLKHFSLLERAKIGARRAQKVP